MKMNEKKIIVFVLLTLLSVKIFPQSMTLDEAIKTTASELGQRLNNNNTANESIERIAEELRRQLNTNNKISVAVLNFSSNWQGLSNYVVDELNNAIVRNGSLTVVDRQQLDLVRQEQKFQISGDVDDKSAQSIGKFLGAQLVLSGSFMMIGNTYRFRIRVIAVETGILQYSNSIDIKKDDVLTALTPAPPKTAGTRRTWSTSGTIFEGYTIYNDLTIFGYTYSPNVPLGFSLGFYGIYTSLGFALPDWGGYDKIGDFEDDITPDFSSTPYTDQRYEIIDWLIGYNVTIIPKRLYLPVGVGIENVKEWRLLQDKLFSDGEYHNKKWNPSPQWETNLIFEAGLLIRVPNSDWNSFSPYIYGSYRYILPDKHSFSIGGGISFEKKY
jgi:TolB-like protein